MDSETTLSRVEGRERDAWRTPAPPGSSTSCELRQDLGHKLCGVRLGEVDAVLLALDAGREQGQHLQDVLRALVLHPAVAVEHADRVVDRLDVEVGAAGRVLRRHLRGDL